MPEEIETEDTGTTLPRRQLGRLLRDARTAVGMSLEDAAALMQWSRPTLSRLERGETERVKIRDVLGFCEIYGLDAEKTAVARGLAEQAPVKSWWHTYGDLIPAWANLFVGLESGATTLTIFQPLIVPGLLQSSDYARVVDRLYFPDDSEDELERRVQVRLQRQHILTRSREPATASIILHENVLRTVVGSHALMSAQLHHIVNMSTRDNIEIRVMPFDAGIPLGSASPPFTILEFSRGRGSAQVTEPPQVYCEGYAGGVYLERRADVLKYRQAFRILRQASLDPRPSRDLLREIAARRHESER